MHRTKFCMMSKQVRRKISARLTSPSGPVCLWLNCCMTRDLFSVDNFLVCLCRSSAYLTLGISSVCTSFTPWFCAKTVVAAFKAFQPPCMTSFYVCGTQMSLQISQCNSLDCGRHSIRWVGKFAFSTNNSVFRKRCKIGPWLLWITSRKCTLQNRVIFDDLEWPWKTGSVWPTSCVVVRTHACTSWPTMTKSGKVTREGSTIWLFGQPLPQHRGRVSALPEFSGPLPTTTLFDVEQIRFCVVTKPDKFLHGPPRCLTLVAGLRGLKFFWL